MVSPCSGREKALKDTAIKIKELESGIYLEEHRQAVCMAAGEEAKWAVLYIDREIIDEKRIGRNLLLPRTLMASI